MVILKIINFCKKQNLDIINVYLDLYYHYVKKKNSVYLNQLQLDCSSDEIFYQISIEMNKIYSNEVLNNLSGDEIKIITNFINDNYRSIFVNYYNKWGKINDDDYDECIISLMNNFKLEMISCDIILGNYIETII